MQGEHLLHQGDQAVVVREVGWIDVEWERLKILDHEIDIYSTDYDFHHKGTKLTKNAQRRINKKISRHEFNNFLCESFVFFVVIVAVSTNTPYC